MNNRLVEDILGIFATLLFTTALVLRDCLGGLLYFKEPVRRRKEAAPYS